MSNGIRKLKKSKKKYENNIHNHEIKLRRNNKYKCPYNNTLCGELSCKSCGVYNEMNNITDSKIFN